MAESSPIQTKGKCAVCGGSVSRNPDDSPVNPGKWRHLYRENWIDNPHNVELEKAP